MTDEYEARVSWSYKIPCRFIKEIVPGVWLVSSNAMLYYALRAHDGEYWQLSPVPIGGRMDCLMRAREMAWHHALVSNKKAAEGDLEEYDLELSHVLRDLADAYESMVEAMHYEHDEAVKFLHEANELRDALNEQKDITERIRREHDKLLAKERPR